MDWLLETLIELAIGAIAGAVTAYFAYKVYETISQSNLMRIVREALKNSADQTAKKIMGDALKVVVKEKRGNVIKIDSLSMDSGDQVTTEITASAISQDVYEGLEMYSAA